MVWKVVWHGGGKRGPCVPLGLRVVRDLLILYGFGLQWLYDWQSTDLYELVIARHRDPLS